MWWVLHTDDAKKNRPAPSALPVKSVLRQRHEVGSTTYRARTVSAACSARRLQIPVDEDERRRTVCARV